MEFIYIPICLKKKHQKLKLFAMNLKMMNSKKNTVTIFFLTLSDTVKSESNLYENSKTNKLPDYFPRL